MTDNIEKIADAAAGIGEVAKLGGKVYDDLISPTAKEVGLTAGSAAGAQSAAAYGRSSASKIGWALRFGSGWTAGTCPTIGGSRRMLNC